MSARQTVQSLSDRKTISQEVAEVLRWRIIRGELAAGDRITEEKVAKEFNISRGPVREAVRELERDGLLVMEAYRGAIVLGITADDLRGVLLPVRHVLEQWAVEHALEALDESGFTALEQLVDEMSAKVDGSSDDDLLRSLVELDVAFHSYIIDKFGGSHARQVWASIAPRVLAGFYRLGSLHSHPGEIVAEHKDLLQALRTRDLVVAREALAEHVIASPIRLLDLVVDEDGKQK